MRTHSRNASRGQVTGFHTVTCLRLFFLTHLFFAHDVFFLFVLYSENFPTLLFFNSLCFLSVLFCTHDVFQLLCSFTHCDFLLFFSVRMFSISFLILLTMFSIISVPLLTRSFYSFVLLLTIFSCVALFFVTQL